MFLPTKVHDLELQAAPYESLNLDSRSCALRQRVEIVRPLQVTDVDDLDSSSRYDVCL